MKGLALCMPSRLTHSGVQLAQKATECLPFEICQNVNKGTVPEPDVSDDANLQQQATGSSRIKPDRPVSHVDEQLLARLVSG